MKILRHTYVFVETKIRKEKNKKHSHTNDEPCKTEKDVVSEIHLARRIYQLHQHHKKKTVKRTGIEKFRHPILT